MDTKTIIAAVQQKIGVAADGNASPSTWAALYQTIFGASPANDLTTQIKAVQTKTGAAPDGDPGPKTWQAVYDFLFKGNKAAQPDSDITLTAPVDERSEKCIATLLPEIQGKARALVHLAAAAGITIRIISGLRSYEEQNALYAKGRTAPGSIVTNAKAGFSNHNFGLAFDIGVFENGQYVPDSPKYKRVGSLAKDLDLTWGGDWRTIKDEPHFELRPSWARALSEGDMLAELRKRKDEGSSLMA